MGEGSWIHVLVVDDCMLDRRIVEKMLLKNGVFKVTTVESGEKAVELLGLNEAEEKVEVPSVNDIKIDIVLTDYCMPGMSGFDLLKAVKEHKSLKSIPVVLMSSENDSERISRCRETGADDFILKPLLPKDIQKLRSYVIPIVTAPPIVGAKRKLTIDIMSENNGSERRPRLTGVVVA